MNNTPTDLRAYLSDLKDELAIYKEKQRHCGRCAAPVIAEEIAMVERDIQSISAKICEIESLEQNSFA